MNYTLPELKYEYDALEPHIDAKTMEIHHSKHHAAYINNLNSALDGQKELVEMPIEELIVSLDEVPESIRATVRNNGGGHFNHTLFWNLLSPTATQPSKELLSAIELEFGGLEKMKEMFHSAALTRFGSGWAWLVVDDKKLRIISTPNQDNPKMENSAVELLLGLDVWEHAYYLNYQNRRADYINAWWNVVNWDEASTRYKNAAK